ncbi:PPC domain-containing protein [Alkalimarinus sediminis]|uniref:Pre-peptidase C-terminal domain-containing protein n=1 Tax=Alkalimarinus sediminis TaxID=1632866 RepID=A0A9E8HM22_9ALTE|nr:PPC domain-containing protein [Alkalimarinus sediminis]UZW76607.1 pre-peptidase C-terminal domain-containing protein [Alkalimarinus sediminis]
MTMNGLKVVVVGMLIATLTACGGSGNGGEIIYSDTAAEQGEQTVVGRTALELQQEITHFMTADPEGNLDKYYFKSEKDQTVSLRITLIESPNKGILSHLQSNIETSTGRKISSMVIPHNNTGLVDVYLEKDESLMVDLSRFGVFVYEYYEYSIELLPATGNGLIQDDEHFEPNNTTATAYPISSRGILQSELLLGSVDQYDVYRVDLEAGVNYTVSLTNHQGNGRSAVGGLRLEVTDKNQTPLVSMVDFRQYEAGHYVVTPTQTGQYFIRVSSPVNSISNNDYFKYDLALWPEHQQLDTLFNHQTLEPNDTAPLAVPINLGEQVTSELERGPNDFIDNYTLPLVAGGQYQLSVSAIDGPARSLLANLRVVVINKNETQILMEERLINKGETLNYVLAPLHDTEAVVRLYYTPTSGHQVDYYKYQLSIEQQ